METWEIIKDIAVVLIPSGVSIITCIINKKTKKDIQLELEKNLKEKDADTLQIIQKINAELESQKQLVSWSNSIPQTNAYTELAGTERYGNINTLHDLIDKVYNYINTQNLSTAELEEIQSLLMKVNLPLEEDHLYPYEIPHIIEYQKLLRYIEDLISSSKT
ncbi:MAG: hypothetical protein HFJ89_02760 [Oscillospiraceae bacterium]|jgi:hypothetical protein|nr:hypothetical protein [Oscillospiraceae bacterium]